MLDKFDAKADVKSMRFDPKKILPMKMLLPSSVVRGICLPRTKDINIRTPGGVGRGSYP